MPDKQKIASTKKLIGQIATQAYKSGGVPSNLTLFFGSNNTGSLTDTIDIADQAMRSQNSAMDKLTQQNATNVNSQARLEAVEAEIKDLKAKADAALAKEKVARDEAAAKKAKVDKLIADTARLDKELEAAKPGIQKPNWQPSRPGSRLSPPKLSNGTGSCAKPGWLSSAG